MRSIRRQLLVWLIAGMLACLLASAVAVYVKVRHEADELLDYQLRQIATSLPLQAVSQPPDGDNDPEDDILIQMWDRTGALVYRSHPNRVLPRYGQGGWRTVRADGHRWRVFGDARQDRFVQVAQAVDAREELALGLAARSVLPLSALVPALALLIVVIVGRSLKPLKRLTRALRQRSPDAQQPLDAGGMPPEIRPVVEALNGLLDRLGRALDAQRAFVADAAHELRSPLAALKLQLQLAERARTDESRAAALARLHERLDRAAHLVQQLLTLARHEPQLAAQAMEPVDLTQLARQVVADQDALAESRGIDLGAEAGMEPVIVQGHFDSLLVMLGNLVDNAVRYTPAGGRVDVVVSMRSAQPCLSVVDNGPGIDAQERARVFDRFFRGEGATAPGSGLGLAIVRNIADRHRARVELGDNPSGRGLVVTVRFAG